MIVNCLHNKPGDLPQNYLDPLTRFSKQDKFPLTIGKQYVVYGIVSRLDQIHYVICDDDYEILLGKYYPRFWPAPLFNIINNNISAHWRVGHNSTHKDYTLIVSYQEWVEDFYYFDRLTDLNNEATEIFRRYKQLMDKEAKIV